MKRPWERRWTAALVTAIALTTGSPAEAQYQKWTSPDAKAARDAAAAQSRERLQQFVDRLKALVDNARKAQAADPRFLRDLDDLARGYDRPWRRLVLDDDFTDGDFENDPAWTVTKGAYWVDGRWGLRNRMSSGAAGSRELHGGDLAAAIIGSILTQGGGQGPSPQPAAGAGNSIHSPQAITNAFAVELELTSLATPARFAVSIYQGTERNTGYRLIYISGEPLRLTRYTGRGDSVIEASAKDTALEDKKVHRLDWRRGTDGAMTVALDGKQVMKVVDRGFRDAFQGIQLEDGGGDFIVRRVAVHATE